MGKEVFRLIVRIIGLLRGRAWLVPLLAVILILSSLIPVGSAYFLQIAVDGIISQTAAAFRRGILLGLIVGLAGAVNAGLPMYLRVVVVESLSKEMRDSLVSSVLSMPLLEAERKPRGDLISRLTTDIDTGSRMLTNMYFFTETILRAIVAFVCMIAINWRVGFACAATGPALLAVSGLLAKPVSKASGDFQATLGEVASDALNFLEGAAVVKAYTGEQFAEEAFGKKAHKTYTAGTRLSLLTALNAGWSGMSSLLPFVVAIVCGGYVAAAGQLTLGGVLALVTLCNNLAWPLNYLGYYLSEISKARGALERVMAILDEPAESDPVPLVEPNYRADEVETHEDLPAVEVNGLSFQYEEGRPVLQDVSLRIEGGAFACIVGKSGCGKSTLLKIIAGLYRPPLGSVFVLGRDVHYNAISFVRKKVAYMPQEPFVYPATIEENLRLGRTTASQEDIWDAIELAQAAEFIVNHPDGLSMIVGEGGQSLSGGERQRLAIARTVLREAEILLLDEPTSGVDKESESRIWDALRRLMKGKTTILVTHRLDMARTADVIFVMDSGRIVESGTHEELLERESLYRLLYAGYNSSVPSDSVPLEDNSDSAEFEGGLRNGRNG